MTPSRRATQSHTGLTGTSQSHTGTTGASGSRSTGWYPDSVPQVHLVHHPFPPLYNEESELLILGSFPSVRSREQSFFYGHPQNRFWKVIAGIFHEDVPGGIDEKKALILDHHLALWDVIAECEIIGSSDASIRKAKPNDISSILKGAPIRKIIVNGKTAEKLYIKHIEPVTGMKATVLPSTSPANAAWNLDRLMETWGPEILAP
ncbi:MAG: DNA-deoxyinosine glycosylase [Lachnospiraceae bacterium]|nr:DNA-deoxyinosine glycosylase [Lachnospiraceae bacterium]